MYSLQLFLGETRNLFNKMLVMFALSSIPSSALMIDYHELNWFYSTNFHREISNLLHPPCWGPLEVHSSTLKHDIISNLHLAAQVFLLPAWPSAYAAPYTMTARHLWKIHINIHSAPSACINNASLSARVLRAPIYKEYKWCPCMDKKCRSEERWRLPAGWWADNIHT